MQPFGPFDVWHSIPLRPTSQHLWGIPPPFCRDETHCSPTRHPFFDARKIGHTTGSQNRETAHKIWIRNPLWHEVGEFVTPSHPTAAPARSTARLSVRAGRVPEPERRQVGAGAGAGRTGAAIQQRRPSLAAARKGGEQAKNRISERMFHVKHSFRNEAYSFGSTPPPLRRSRTPIPRAMPRQQRPKSPAGLYITYSIMDKIEALWHVFCSRTRASSGKSLVAKSSRRIRHRKSRHSLDSRPRGITPCPRTLCARVGAQVLLADVGAAHVGVYLGGGDV